LCRDFIFWDGIQFLSKCIENLQRRVEVVSPHFYEEMSRPADNTGLDIFASQAAMEPPSLLAASELRRAVPFIFRIHRRPCRRRREAADLLVGRMDRLERFADLPGSFGLLAG